VIEGAGEGHRVTRGRGSLVAQSFAVYYVEAGRARGVGSRELLSHVFHGDHPLTHCAALCTYVLMGCWIVFHFLGSHSLPGYQFCGVMAPARCLS